MDKREELFEVLEDMGAEPRIRIRDMGNEPDFYLTYLVELPENQNIVSLNKAMDEKNFEAVRREAHALKGVCENFALLPVIDYCSALLGCFKAGKTERADLLVEKINKEFEKFSDVILEYRDEIVLKMKDPLYPL